MKRNELATASSEGMKAARTLPLGVSYQYVAAFPDVSKDFDALSVRLNKLIVEVTSFATATDRASEFNMRLHDSATMFAALSNRLDDVLDRVDNHLVDTGNKGLAKPEVKMTAAALRGWGIKRDQVINVMHASNILRPQLLFPPGDIDNSESPFVPRIKVKHNAREPLDPIFSLPPAEAARAALGHAGVVSHIHSLGLATDGGGLTSTFEYPHPYKHELAHLTYPSWLFEPSEEIKYRSLDDTPFTWVDSLDALTAMIASLKKVNVVALDLENHSYRSYQGFLCLLQVSTREADWVVDVIALRAQMWRLNEVTSNPAIIKVMHGSDSDVLWFQRDFGVYVVGLFDTGQASRLLDYPSASLAYILKLYCDVDADKKYQRADWRIRPLPAEMLKYAREDTHYLLYMFDRQRSELLARSNVQTNLVDKVLQLSLERCQATYTKLDFVGLSAQRLYRTFNRGFNSVQFRIYHTVYKWRDELARKEDESTTYVIPGDRVFTIVERCPLTASDLLACFPSVPPLVAKHAHELVALIVAAASDTGPSTSSSVDGEDRRRTGTASREGGGSASQPLLLTAEQAFRAAGWVERALILDGRTGGRKSIESNDRELRGDHALGSVRSVVLAAANNDSAAPGTPQLPLAAPLTHTDTSSAHVFSRRRQRAFESWKQSHSGYILSAALRNVLDAPSAPPPSHPSPAPSAVAPPPLSLPLPHQGLGRDGRPPPRALTEDVLLLNGREGGLTMARGSRRDSDDDDDDDDGNGGGESFASIASAAAAAAASSSSRRIVHSSDVRTQWSGSLKEENKSKNKSKDKDRKKDKNKDLNKNKDDKGKKRTAWEVDGDGSSSEDGGMEGEGDSSKGQQAKRFKGDQGFFDKQHTAADSNHPSHSHGIIKVKHHHDHHKRDVGSPSSQHSPRDVSSSSHSKKGGKK